LTSHAVQAGCGSIFHFEQSMSHPARRVGLVLLTVLSAAACPVKEQKQAESVSVSPEPVRVPPRPEPARAALVINPNALYAIVATASGKCLQFAERSTLINARAVLAACDGSKAQQFRLVTTPDNYQTITIVLTNKCLDIEGVNDADGAHVQEYDCNGGPNQQWIVADGIGGAIRLVARHSGKVMDVEGSGTADGTPVNQSTWTSGPNQQFKLNIVQPTATVEDKGTGGKGAGAAKPGDKTDNKTAEHKGSNAPTKSAKGKKSVKTRAASDQSPPPS
jgi:hypothetical protein